MTHDPVTRRYTEGDYARQNPDWDSADSPWKAHQVLGLLARHGLSPASVVEVGCGAGGVLSALRAQLPQAELRGFDIAPGLPALWSRRQADDIHFTLGDYLASDEPAPELTMVLDVLEHLGDPFSFLARLRERTGWTVFHIPLDLSAISVLRERPLLHVRHKVGHLHYFTRGLAVAMLEECGYEIVEARYTGASLNAPRRSFKTRMAGLLRQAIYAVHHDLGARLMGGETLLVLARPKVAA
ncbi:methyltransferase domain-containing protein [Hydrogenophaga sp. 2FB]|uniref:class I SAM-dependent methyltransferase n=1 Tax=Hydrogenophaga sp. 2FB TaxID=2502187 RepID=UPI0014851BE2|nr:methyltransferase domain-containing protein [Hydrogenophaga sp. 2FB]